MPEFKFDLPSDEPLFTEPFTLSIPKPGGGVVKVGLQDRGNPPDEEDVNPETKPLSYFRDLIVEQVIPDDREAARAAITEALTAEPPLLDMAKMAEAFGWIQEQRAEAEKNLTKKVTGRPTGGRSRSPRS